MLVFVLEICTFCVYIVLRKGVKMSQTKNEKDRDELILKLGDAIVILTLDNQELARQLAEERIISANLKSKLDAIVEENKGCINNEFIARFVRNSFQNGNIPIPKQLLAKKLPVEVFCLPSDIHFSESRGFLITVTFKVGDSRSYSTNFQISLIPDLVNPDDPGELYPNFIFCFWDGLSSPVSTKRKTVKKK